MLVCQYLIWECGSWKKEQRARETETGKEGKPTQKHVLVVLGTYWSAVVHGSGCLLGAGGVKEGRMKKVESMTWDEVLLSCTSKILLKTCAGLVTVVHGRTEGIWRSTQRAFDTLLFWKYNTTMESLSRKMQARVHAHTHTHSTYFR